MNADSVLGGLLLNNSAFDDVAALVNVDCFTTKQHRMIWQAISDRTLRGEPCDVVTLSEYLRQHGASGNVLSYLGDIAKNTPSAANVTSYARLLRSEWIGRQMRDACGEAMSDAGKPEEVLSSLETKLAKLTSQSQTSGPAPMSDRIGGWMDSLEARVDAAGDVFGLATGLRDLDAKIGGLKGGDYMVVAARPSMGKSALAFQIAAQDHAGYALVFSMEMPTEQIISRYVATNYRIPLEKINHPKQLEGDEWHKISEAVQGVRDKRLLVDDSPALSIHDIRARSRSANRRYPLSVVVVDYIGLAKADKENRTQEVGEISRGLKALAKELSVPVIALCQLNRSVEQRHDKRPVMSDLRESGDIEQDADIVLMLYRDDYYNPDTANKGVSEALIRKHRNGPTGTVYLAWLPEITRFESLAQDYEPVRENVKQGGFQAKPGDKWRQSA